MQTNNKTVDILCSLLRIAMGTEKNVSLQGCDTISWHDVYVLARKQGVLAVAFDGLMQILERDGEFARVFPQPLKLQWINATLTIEQRYNRQRDVCADLAKKWAEQNVRTLCLKGLAFSTFYPIPHHRECGDFDCYLYDDYAKGNDIVRELGVRVDESMYKHSEFVYRKVMVENHRFIVAVRGGRKMKQLHNLLDNMARTQEQRYIFDTKIEMPSPMFNALFMNYHSLTHFLSEGIRLRHVLDWTMFLQREQDRLDWVQFYAFCKEYDMRAFVDCMTAIAVQIFGIEITNSQIVSESPYAERVFCSIIEDDNAVFSQNVGAWSKRLMLVKNLFTSHWKYRAFSNQGIFTKFASLVWGFLTHPEED